MSLWEGLLGAKKFGKANSPLSSAGALKACDIIHVCDVTMQDWQSGLGLQFMNGQNNI